MSFELSAKQRHLGTAAVVAALLLVGCGATTHWHKPGHNQRDFAIDAGQCEQVATEMAAAASLTPARPNIELYADHYAKCLMEKGWSPGPPLPATKKTGGPNASSSVSEAWPEISIDPGKNLFTAFEIDFQVPEDFRFMGQFKQSAAVVLKKNLLWASDKQEFLVISIQKARGKALFQDMDYPFRTKEDFLFDQSRKGSGNTHWRAFCSPQDDQLMGLVGTSHRIDKSRRIMVAASLPLPPADSFPQNHMKLAEIQYAAMAAFTDRWSVWLEKALPSPPVAWRIPFSPLEIIGEREK